MGLLTEYFTAPDDTRAATALATGPTRAGFATVDAYGVEPYVQLGTLEEILTGDPYEQVAARQTDPVADAGGGEVFVARLTAEVTTALAGLTDDRVPDVAAGWAATEEFAGATDPAALADLLRALAALARGRGTDPLYCWLSV